MKLNMLNEQPTGRDPKDPTEPGRSPEAASSLVWSRLESERDLHERDT